MPFTNLFSKKSHTHQAANIIIAPDKFKGTLSASEVTGTIANALSASFPTAQLHLCPMADGGEGTAKILATQMGLQQTSVKGHDALMQECQITYYAANGTCAVDSAEIIGLTKLIETGRPLTPWQTTTHGIGEFITKMIENGAKQIYIGIGGTATIDGGIGMLAALGARFFDVEGTEITERPLRARHLGIAYSADLSQIKRPILNHAIIALADVDTPLLPNNETELSSLSFATQKGLLPEDIPILAKSLRNFRSAIDARLLTPAIEPHFQGAGGGLGYALHRILRCQCTLGAEHISSLYNIQTTIKNPNSILITGEGCFDNQSNHGKVAGTLAHLAASNNAKTIIICGQCSHETTTDSHITPTIIATSKHMSPTTPITHKSAKLALESSMADLTTAIARITSNQAMN